MAVPDLDNLLALLDDAKCFALVRQHRWPNGVRCPACASSTVIRDGRDDTQRSRQRYRCKACAGRFDDLTGTVLAGHHQPLRVWVLCLYFMGLNLSKGLSRSMLKFGRGVLRIDTTRHVLPGQSRRRQQPSDDAPAGRREAAAVGSWPSACGSPWWPRAWRRRSSAAPLRRRASA